MRTLCCAPLCSRWSTADRHLRFCLISQAALGRTQSTPCWPTATRSLRMFAPGFFKHRSTRVATLMNITAHWRSPPRTGCGYGSFINRHSHSCRDAVASSGHGMLVRFRSSTGWAMSPIVFSCLKAPAFMMFFMWVSSSPSTGTLLPLHQLYPRSRTSDSCLNQLRHYVLACVEENGMSLSSGKTCQPRIPHESQLTPSAQHTPHPSFQLEDELFHEEGRDVMVGNVYGRRKRNRG